MRASPTHLTIRNVPPGVAAALEKEKRRRGASLNQTVVELLGERLGIDSAKVRSNGLRRLAGRWTETEAVRIERRIAEVAERVDDELWR